MLGFRSKRCCAAGRLLPVVLAAHCLAQSGAGQDTLVPQTALSLCPALEVVERREIAPGTRIGVAPNGEWLAAFVHTTRGGEVRLRRLAPGPPAEDKVIPLVPPSLPPGINWRIFEARFSPDSRLLVVRSTGALDVLDAAAGVLLHRVTYDADKQLYPGVFSLTDDTLAVSLWPAESILAEATASSPIEIRLLDAMTGKWLRSLKLAVSSSNDWTRIALAPDTSRLGVLERARRWPGKGRLSVYSLADGSMLWAQKVAAEDFDFARENNAVMALGSRLVWLDAKTGKKIREAEGDAGTSEYQLLRLNAAAGLAAGHFSRFSSMRRALGGRGESRPLLLLWQLDSAKTLCRVEPPLAVAADVWLTAEGRLVVLEERYDLRPQLRLLKSAQLVTYRLSAPRP